MGTEGFPASEANGEKSEKYPEILTDYLADFVKQFRKIDLLPQDHQLNK